MRKFIFVVVIAIFAWGYFKKDVPHRTAADLRRPDPVKESTQIDRQPDSRGESQFKCDGREYCSQMNSRAEAEYFLKNCPNTKMDGDKDGIPCENDSRF